MRDMTYVATQYLVLAGFVAGWTLSMEFLIARAE